MGTKNQKNNFLDADNHIFLLSSRAFTPLFWSQFFSALNDNFVKNILVLLIVTCSSLEYQASLISLTSSVFSFPYLLFSATGGQLADRFNKAQVAQLIKFFTLFVALTAAFSLLISSVTLLMICLFLFGSAAALFGPVKYAVLPDHMAKSHLPRANAWVETATLIAILLGTLWAGISFDFGNKPQTIPALIVIILAIISWGTSCFMPKNTPAQPNLVIDKNIIRATISIIKFCIQEKRLLIASLMVSWFWFIGATFLSIIPALTASLEFLPYGNISFLTFIAIFGTTGSWLSAWLSAGRIILLQSVIGTFVFGLSCLDLSLVVNGLNPELKARTLIEFCSHPQLLHIMFDFALAATSSTFIVVPGFAALQAWAEPSQRARIIAANNILNAATITAGMSIITFIQYLGASLGAVIFILGTASLIASIFMLRYLPN